MASMTIQKHTTASACTGQVAHIYRERENYGNPDIDKARAEGNLYAGEGAECRQRIKDTIRELDEKTPPKRVRSDRKTVASIVIPAPREDTTPEQAKRFFQSVVSELEGKGYLICGGAVHADEVHEYIDPSDKQKHMSRLHAHVLVVPYTQEKGCNMKAWLTRSRYKEINDTLNRVCERELGYQYNDGTLKRSSKTVEELKVQSVKADTENRIQALQERRKQAEKLVSGTEVADVLEKRTVGFIRKRELTVCKDVNALQAELDKSAVYKDENSALSKTISALTSERDEAIKELDLARKDVERMTAQLSHADRYKEDAKLLDLIDRVAAGEVTLTEVVRAEDGLGFLDIGAVTDRRTAQAFDRKYRELFQTLEKAQSLEARTRQLEKALWTADKTAAKQLGINLEPHRSRGMSR